MLPYLVGLGAVALAACGERARLIFEPESNSTGPQTTIDSPEGDPTHVPEGPFATVAGRSVDLDGVDTLHAVVVGGRDHFGPLLPDQPTDTMRFLLPITTSGLKGDTIVVLVYGVDHNGAVGDTSSRALIVE